MIPYDLLQFEERSGPTTTASVVNLLAAPYGVQSFSATVAPLSTNQIAGSGYYDDVDDVISLDITGDTAAAVSLAYHTLADTLDQARRWNDGENVNPIIIAARIQGSTVGRLEAVVLGPSDGQAPAQASPEFDVAVGCWVIRGVEVAFRRRALWLADAASADQANTISVTNPIVQTLTFANDQGDVIAPVFLSIEDTAVTTSIITSSTLIAYVGSEDATTAARSISIMDATTLTPATDYANVADAASFPYSGTNVLRFTPTATTARLSDVSNFTFPTMHIGRQVAIAIALRTSGTTSYTVRVRVNQGTTAVAPVIYTRPVFVAGNTARSYVPLGIVPVALGAGAFNYQLEITASAASGFMEISHLVAVNVDNPASTIVTATETNTLPVIELRSQAYRENTTPLFGASFTATGGGEYRNSGSYPQFDYKGSVEIGASGRSIAVCLLSTTASTWTLVSGGSKIGLTAFASRRRAYRTPQ